MHAPAAQAGFSTSVIKTLSKSTRAAIYPRSSATAHRCVNVFVCVRVWRMRACRVRVRCVCVLFTGARSWRAVVDSSLSSSSSTSLSSSSSSSGSRARFAAACLTSIEGLAGAEEEREEPPPWPTVPLAELEHLPSPFPSPHASPSPLAMLYLALVETPHIVNRRGMKERKGETFALARIPIIRDRAARYGAFGALWPPGARTASRSRTTSLADQALSSRVPLLGARGFLVPVRHPPRGRPRPPAPPDDARSNRILATNLDYDSRLRLDYVINDEGYRALVAWIARDLHYRWLRENATNDAELNLRARPRHSSREHERRVSTARGKRFLLTRMSCVVFIVSPE